MPTSLDRTNEHIEGVALSTLLRVNPTTLELFRQHLAATQERFASRPPDMERLYGSPGPGISYLLIDPERLSQPERTFLAEHGAEEVEGVVFRASRANHYIQLALNKQGLGYTLHSQQQQLSTFLVRVSHDVAWFWELALTGEPPRISQHVASQQPVMVS